MAFLKETIGSMKAFFIVVGVIGLLKMNIISIIFGILFIYFGIKLDKLLPEKKKIILAALSIGLALNLILSTYIFAKGSLTTADVVSTIISIVFFTYLIVSVNRISSESQNISQENQQEIPNTKEEHTIRNIAILLVVALITGFVLYRSMNTL